METRNFWNEAAKCGAILGALLALSGVAEASMTISGNLSTLMLIIPEWIIVVVLHYYLLHRFTRNRSRLYSEEEGFSFGQAYGFLLAVSGLAGVLYAIVQYAYVHWVIGYSTYIEKMSAMIENTVLQNPMFNGSMQSIYREMLVNMQNAPEPSILASMWNGIFGSIAFGLVFGLIIAGVVSRKPNLFSAGNNEEKNE